MNLIKIYGLITLLVALSFVALKNSPFEKTPELSNTIPEKGEILPADQWLSILDGKWKVSFILQNPTDIILVDGGITFYATQETRVSHMAKDYIEDFNYQHYNSDSPNTVKISRKYRRSIGKVLRKGRLLFWEKKSKSWIDKKIGSIKDGCNNSLIWQNATQVLPGFGFCEKLDPIVGFIGNYPGYEILSFTHNLIQLKVNAKDFTEPVIITYSKNNQ